MKERINTRQVQTVAEASKPVRRGPRKLSSEEEVTRALMKLGLTEEAALAGG